MAPDDLNAPLGRKKKKKLQLPVAAPQVLAGVLGLFVLIAVGWAMFANDPLGGRPVAVVATTPATPAGDRHGGDHPKAMANAAEGAMAKAAMPSADGRTITIIDGSSGKHHDVTVPGNGTGPAAKTLKVPHDAAAKVPPQESRQGMIPQIAPDGERAFVRYATPFKVPENRKDAPRIAIVLGDLGISASGTVAAINALPAPVTLAFAPYSNNLQVLTAQARSAGHELLLQLPMEPLDYPNNDPGPRTLLTSLSDKQNIKRLHWLMGRFQGYVGVASFMGARFTASSEALTPVLREIARRGLMYVDDGSSARSIAGQIASTLNLPFVKANSVLDAVPTPIEVERALRRLEMTARANGTAVGYASAQPSVITAINQWAKEAKRRGFLLVPITMVMAKTKSS